MVDHPESPATTYPRLAELRGRGLTVLVVEQNAHGALQIFDTGIVMELGRLFMVGPAAEVSADPGQLPQDWTLERLMGKHPSCPYNPLIANAFFRSGYIESWGRGIEKISRECREHGIDAPLYDHSMSGLTLTFHANPQHLLDALESQDARRILGEKVGEKVGETLTANRRRILLLLRQNARLSARELALDVGISSRKVEQNIARLKVLGLLQRIGPAKGGHWKVME